MDIVLLKKLDHVDQFLMTFTSMNTRVAYERDLKDYVSFAASGDPLSFSTLAQYRDALIASSAPATVVRKFSAVKSFFSFLASTGVISHNPAQNLKVPRSRTLEPTEAFSDEEVVRVIAQAQVGTMHRLALVLLFQLGIRRSELVNLRVGSMREHRGSRFLVVDGKGGKQRMIPLTSAVLAEIESYLETHAALYGAYPEPTDYLLRSCPVAWKNKPVDPSTIFRIVKSYAKAAGVTKRVSPHSCRATMISHLLEKNVSPRSVADIAGHSSIQTTVGIYDKKRDALSNPAAELVIYDG